jgi:hypothetical protein
MVGYFGAYDTVTACMVHWPSSHVFTWDEQPGWEVCKCGVRNWNPCEDARIFPDLPDDAD